MKTQTVICGDCLDVMHSQTFFDMIKGKKVIIVTDPPFNVSYHYNEYNAEPKPKKVEKNGQKD